MRVLGVDPGPTSCGFALLEVTGGLAQHIACGAMSGLDLAVEIRDAQRKPDLIAIERGAGAHAGIARKRGAQAALSIAKHGGNAQEIGGFLRGVAWLLGIDVVELAATVVRSHFKIPHRKAHRPLDPRTMEPVTEDVLVERVVRRLISDWPDRSANHERDAGLVGLAAARGVRPPPPVLTARSKPGPRNRVKVSTGQNGTLAK